MCLKNLIIVNYRMYCNLFHRTLHVFCVTLIINCAPQAKLYTLLLPPLLVSEFRTPPGH